MSGSSRKLHNNLNPYFRSRTNPNWKALVDAIGEVDEDTANLIQEVRKQFFIRTAERPYIDRLAANLKIQRPAIVGMDDESFRKFIPIMAYQPKQVKQIIDQLLDVFFFKEATTAFTVSTSFSPFALEDGWELNYVIDGIHEETIRFTSEDFTSISSATAEEVVSAVNRQAVHSFATVFDDRIQKQKYVRIFSKTVGSKGSVEIRGGRANIALRFVGFIDSAGNTANTQWLVTKVGDTTTFQHIGGGSPGLERVQVGDMVIIDLSGNSGSFEITNVDLGSSSFSFVNLFSTPGSYDHSLLTDSYVRFMRLQKSIVWNKTNRAVVWEVSPGEAVVEMPATPPVVRRQLQGSAHVNGLVSNMVDRTSVNSIAIEDASLWPQEGKIVLEPVYSVDAHLLTPSIDENTSTDSIGRFDRVEHYFQYSSKLGNTLNNITPPLPRAAEVVELAVISASRVSSVSLFTTSVAHQLEVGSSVRVVDMSDSSFDGTFVVSAVQSATTFSVENPGPDASASAGYVRVEFIGLKNSGSKVHLASAKINTGIFGPYLWDEAASFVLSSYTGKTVTDIKAGNIILNLQIENPNSIPNETGFLIFDYGLETEEGPVRYLYKASESVIALDPSYVFKFNHSVGSGIAAIRRKGGHVLSGTGSEYAFYISDPSAAREVLQELVRSVKSVGVFLRFIVRYPELYYGTIDVYQSGVDPG